MKGYNIDDYINKQFNHLTLIKNLNKLDKHNSKLALFKCDCGNTKELVFSQVLNGEVQSCGCKTKGKQSNLSKADTRNKRILYNIEHTQKNNNTGHTGISKVGNKYRVRIDVDKHSIHIGYFDTLEIAIKERKKAENKYYSSLVTKVTKKRKIDLTNKRFGSLIALNSFFKKNHTYWLCKCDCGKKCVVRYDRLKNGEVKNCGKKCSTVIYICKHCNKSFNPTRSNNFYCSEKCRLEHVLINKRKRAKEHWKEYYLKNKDKIRIYQKEYYKEHYKEYRLKNKDKLSIHNKKCRLKNKDKLSIYNKEYYLKNKDKIYARRKALKKFRKQT